MRKIQFCLMSVIFVLSFNPVRGYAELNSDEVVVDFFSDTLDVEGRYTYVYPEHTSSITEITTERHSGEASLMITLDPTTYSGASIGSYPIADLTSIRDTGAVEFWIKGARGGERCEVMLLDADDSDGTKCESGVLITPEYVSITKDWQKVSVSLSAFPDEGQYWDGSAVKPDTFDWNEVKEIRFDIRPSDENVEFTIYVDDIKIVKSPTPAGKTEVIEW